MLKSTVLALLCMGTLWAGAQSNEEKFGQNRVQYKSYTFQYYESDNFITYFYQGGQDVGKYVIKTAEDVSDEISTLLDFKYRHKVDIVVYNNINELNQTNIGIYEPRQNPGGTINLPDNKIFIYNNGDHRNIEQQVRLGLAKLYVDKMGVGSNITEFFQNAVLLNLPDWYKYGLIDYIGKEWTSDMENRLRDGILTGRYKKLNKLQPEEAIFVGHSIWHYVEQVHGKTAVSNLIYLTRINRSVDNGFLFVIGTNLAQTLQNWYTYYLNRYKRELGITTTYNDTNRIPIKIRKDFTYYQPFLSPDGKHIAYAGNDMGRYRVYVRNLATGKTKVVFKGGFRTNTLFTDESIPLLAWEPGGKKLAFINDKRSKIFLRFYDVATKKTETNPVRKFQKVVSFAYGPDNKQLVMSAIQNGQTDVYLYNIASTTTKKLTDDYYDDIQPAYIEADGFKGVMFSSNRPDTDLKPRRYESQQLDNGPHDLFFYDLGASRLYRVTNTPFANETCPQNFNDSLYCYLSDENGISNRYTGHLQSVFSHRLKTYYYVDKEYGYEDSLAMHEKIPADSLLDLSLVSVTDSTFENVYEVSGVNNQYTNFTTGILHQSTAPAVNKVLDMGVKKGKLTLHAYTLTAGRWNSTPPVHEWRTFYEKETTNTGGDKKPVEQGTEAVEERSPILQYDTATGSRGNRPFDFQSEFDYGIRLFDWDSATTSKINNAQEGYVFRFSKVRPYFIRFMVDKVITQLDNNLLMTRYQPFDPATPQFNVPPIGFMFKFGITDLLENHKVYGGLSIPFSGPNGTNQYFITYENLTKRLDQKFTFYRKSQGGTANSRLPFSNAPIPSNVTVDYSIKTNYAEIELRYPIDVLNRIGFGLAFRNDKIVFKSKDNFSLNQPSITNNWLFFKTEYVFDNCIEIMNNIRYGARFKVFGEIHKEFPTKNRTSGETDYPVLQFNNNYMVVFGADFRHYLKIYKQFIWANRVAFGASFGNSRLIYYLGAIDNWITGPRVDKFDRVTPINTNNKYAFQTLATPLRGFKQNARNGDKYVVLNSELRFPVFSVLINSPIRSEIIRNFQLVAFMDVGTAWEGKSPFDDDNPLFNEEIPNNPDNPSVIVRVKRYKTPVIFGFGPGLRTTLFSYFFRFDAAWGWDTGELSKKPVYYFTFGTDF